ARDTGAELLLFGHTHRPAHRVVDGVHFVNAGSVGCATDGDPRSTIALVTLAAQVSVELRRLPYDVERAARDAESRGLPREIARRLREGRFRAASAERGAAIGAAAGALAAA